MGPCKVSAIGFGCAMTSSLLVWGAKQPSTKNREIDGALVLGGRCQKPFNLEGVDFTVDSRCKVILDLLKSEFLLENIK